MGSGAGDLARQPPVPSAAYGASKSIVNWYGVRINAEDEWLNAFVLDPGWVQTDMGNAAAQLWGMEEASDTHEKSITGMVEVLSMGTKEQYGGSLCDTRVRFWNGDHSFIDHRQIGPPNLGPTTELGFSHEILLQGKLYENTLAHQ
ncbi:Short-chain dehydrogenase/reductase SDR [Penicillium freii]|nr:Short-chain dehydrogenase/reductase SDR [Penicillium freii]